MAIGRISNWASDLFFPVEGREGSRPGSQERRSHETLAARISQAGRQVLEADRSNEGWTFVAPSPAPLLSREARTPQTLPAISVAAKKARSRKRQALTFEDGHHGHGSHGGHGGHGLTAESSKTDLPNDWHAGQDMSLLSVLQKRHQTLPSAEIGGAPEPGEVKSPRRFQGRRSLTTGPARLSGGRTVPKMSVKQFLELLEATENPRPNSSGRPGEDPKRQEYVLLENLVPPGAHVSVAKVRGAEDQKEVVLKTIRKGWFVTLEDEEQWFRSNSQLQSLDAPSLCRVLELWKEDDSYYLVMELVPGMDLFTMLKAEGAFPPQTARQITKDILEGLVVLHGALQLVHRDIKLQNIMAHRPDSPGEIKAKIIDYDTLWPMSDAKASSRFVVGSDQYIAPEAYDAHYSVASDLFAVGVVCFALCFGRFPFSYKVFDDEPGENLVGSRKMKEIAERLRNATIKWPEGDQEATDFCRWLLNMNPKNRPSDALEALKHPFLRR